jgi:hypothetical protein
MNFLPRKWVVAAVCAVCAVYSASVPARAQSKADRPAPSAAVTIPPLPKSPVEIFRELLAATPAEREQYLSTRSARSREIIEAKLREFGPLTPDQREIRLRVAQLQFHLSPLLRSPVAERAALLAQISEPERTLVEARLKAWDQLSSAAQADLLKNEKSLGWFIKLETVGPLDRMVLIGQMPPTAVPEVERQFKLWKARPERDRLEALANFQRFFDLTPAERERTLRTLSEPERRQMEQTLASFAAMPPEQRDRCVRAFRRFAGMTPVERAGFLQSATVWQKMTPNERDAWRRLVKTLPPPPPLPPLPGRPAITAGR